MPLARVDFGYYPRHLAVLSGPVRIETLPGLDETVLELEASEGVEGDWIYAPLQQVRHFPSGAILARPYSARIFGLPKTHGLSHAAADGADHLAFHLWALSFFTGMRLTATEAGFVDSTPIKTGKLVDFILIGQGLDKAIGLTETFWVSHRSNPERASLFGAVVHTLFLAHHPQHLQFERFLLLYAALDACFALAAALYAPPPRLGHARRIAWMCGLFHIPVPSWADPGAAGGAEAAVIRNAAVHEALFMGAPLGFALHGIGTNQNLPLEIEALICRLLVALLGAPGAAYVSSPINTRQRHGLTLI